jgi:hypothetical protein
MRNETGAAGDYGALGKAIKAIVESKGAGYNADEIAENAYAAFRINVMSTGVGETVQAIMDNDMNALPDISKLYNATRKAPETTIEAAQALFQNMRGGAYPHVRQVGLAVATVMAAGVLYKVGKALVPGNPNDVPPSRIAMNDQGYGNSATPDRYTNYSGGMNTSGLSSLQNLSSATIEDNLSTIKDRELEDIMSRRLS